MKPDVTERNARIVRLYRDEGTSRAELAAFFECSQNAIAGVLSRYGDAHPEDAKFHARRAQMASGAAAAKRATANREITVARPTPDGRNARAPLTRAATVSPIDGARPPVPARPVPDKRDDQRAAPSNPSEPPRTVLHAIERPTPFTLGGGCRWPLWGDKERPTQRFCDAARVPGRPYCPMHCRVAYPGLQRVTAATAAFASATHADPGEHRTNLP